MDDEDDEAEWDEPFQISIQQGQAGQGQEGQGPGGQGQTLGGGGTSGGVSGEEKDDGLAAALHAYEEVSSRGGSMHVAFSTEPDSIIGSRTYLYYHITILPYMDTQPSILLP